MSKAASYPPGTACASGPKPGMPRGVGSGLRIDLRSDGPTHQGETKRDDTLTAGDLGRGAHRAHQGRPWRPKDRGVLRLRRNTDPGIFGQRADRAPRPQPRIRTRRVCPHNARGARRHARRSRVQRPDASGNPGLGGPHRRRADGTRANNFSPRRSPVRSSMGHGGWCAPTKTRATPLSSPHLRHGCR